MHDQCSTGHHPRDSVRLAFRKTCRQSVLNSALHLSDYVTRSMKRLNDQSVDPKVVLNKARHNKSVALQ